MRRAMTVLPVVCLLLVSASLPAAEPLADRLPEGTLLYLGWAGKNKALEDSMMGRLLQEPGLAKMVGAIRQAVARNVGGPDAKPMIEEAWDLAAALLSHPGAVALVGLDVGQGEPVPSLAALFDLGADRAKFAQRLEKLLDSAGMTPEDASTGTLKYKTIPLPPGPLSFGYLGDTLFVCLGKDMPQKLAAVEAAKSLAASKGYAEAMKAVTGPNVQCAFYLDAAGLVKALTPLVEGGRGGPADGRPPQFIRTLDALGVGGLKALAGCIRVTDGYMHTRFRIVSPAPHRGLLLPLAGEPLTDADLAHLPGDMDFLAAWKVSAADLFAEVRRIIKELDPKADEDIARELADPKSVASLLLSKDLLGSLGQTWTFSASPTYGGWILLSVDVKDAAKLSAAIGKIEDRLKAELAPAPEPQENDLLSSLFPRPRAVIEKVSSGGVDVHYVSWSGGFVPVPVAPAWAVHKGRLYLALWPQVVLSAVANEGKNPLTKSADFAALRARLGGNASMITYMDTPRICRQAYPVVLLLWTMASGALSREAGVELKPDWLPPLSAVEKYIRPEMGAVWSDKDGITVEGYGSIPGISAAPMLPAVGVAALMPALASARSQARIAVSKTNLSMIGKGIAIYSAANKDLFPPDLAALIAEAYITPDVLVSPLSGRQPPKFDKEKKTLIGELDYIYFQLDTNADAELICAYERPENHGNKGTNVLFADMHVGYLKMTEFQEALKKTQDYLKERRSKKPANKKGEDF